MKYYSGYQFKKIEMGGACSTFGEEMSCIPGVGGETWGKRPLGRTRRRWKIIYVYIIYKSIRYSNSRSESYIVVRKCVRHSISSHNRPYGCISSEILNDVKFTLYLI
jgi:hypothetical protein